MEAIRYVSEVLPPKRASIVLLNIMTKVPESFWDLEKEPSFHYRIANISAWEVQQEQMIKEFMDRAADILVDGGVARESVTIRIQQRMVGISRDIISESHKGYDAVVVGRTGLSNLKDLVLGSIADKIIGKLGDVPVWVVGGYSHSKKVLVSIDTSQGAMQAVDYVGNILAGVPQVHVTLFHAIRGLDVFIQGYNDSFMLGQESEWLEKAERELTRAAEEIEPVMEKAVTRLTRAGFEPGRIDRKVVKGISSRAGAIVDEAQRGDYGTIVVGRRGLSRIQEFFMGRVSNKVIQLAKTKAVWVVS
jgi:nucleotide-binding universal stress UspA family protein